ncbi:MAG: UDP-N-acetylenolpyruvoylglucosamine reductase [Pseudomonadales bacterium]|nr:UDP-N-acetylenolpyruvoylglucosamine reductase [Pseudomonadales bacterium]MAQ26245.1 UDP-N-acetylenolpyruvoylglucosamine reductase [Pseudomonadales bacterium]MEC8809934.1 UDP-N-acetylmuramate dehydrogenase [Pseudomonadota bacterium]HAG96203.1 hypothetical protein [Gammaproteobacteria bacterium]HAU14741.1 hypothetical protein [Gammaproteobacteria bacterium]
MSITIAQDYSLRPFNTLAVAARAAHFCKVQSVLELQQVLAQNTDPLLILGGGSNLVLTGDFPGLVILNRIPGIEMLEQTADQVLIRVGAGEIWDHLVETCVARGWFGLENLSWIPGSVGAAPIQNIGAYGVELKDVVECVETLYLEDLLPRTFSARQCRFGYRDSVFKRSEQGRHIITHVQLRLSRQPSLHLDYGEIRRCAEQWGYDIAQLTPLDVRQIIIRIRSAKLPDPATAPNVGSFFKNPLVGAADFERIKADAPGVVAYPQADGTLKLAAGWLIDQLGWKGRRQGCARVHDRQALVLINEGSSSHDLLELAGNIQQAVLQRWGIELEIEPSVV